MLTTTPLTLSRTLVTCTIQRATIGAKPCVGQRSNMNPERIPNKRKYNELVIVIFIH